ncbi:MAG: ACT domain-containing protein [Opitutaceae bacterium]|jgi:acetolactate synthase-1/3 small subunit
MPSAHFELLVRNHPGAMSHITRHFSRRAFNLEAILCTPIGDGETSRILLLVADDPRLGQVKRQLSKLNNVLSVTHRNDLPADYFAQLSYSVGSDCRQQNTTSMTNSNTGVSELRRTRKRQRVKASLPLWPFSMLSA